MRSFHHATAELIGIDGNVCQKLVVELAQPFGDGKPSQLFAISILHPVHGIRALVRSGRSRGRRHQKVLPVEEIARVGSGRFEPAEPADADFLLAAPMCKGPKGPKGPMRRAVAIGAGCARCDLPRQIIPVGALQSQAELLRHLRDVQHIAA